MDANISDDDIDNIVDSITTSPIVAVASTDDELLNEYEAKFDLVEENQKLLSNLIKTLPIQPNQDRRLGVALEYIQGQQRLNELTLDLLISMNNMFANK